MLEPETIAVREGKKRAKQNEDYTKYKASRPAGTPFKITDDGESYKDQVARHKYDEEVERNEIARKKAEKAAHHKEIAEAQDAPGAVTSAQLYEGGLVSREAGRGLDAATLLWQALLCGEDRAAYPLFEMLRDGEGISKNLEMSGLILSVGKYLDEPRCKTIGLVKIPNHKSITDIYVICREAKRDFGEKLITPELIAMKQQKAIEQLDRFDTFHTREEGESMVSVFAHDDDFTYDVAVAGAADGHGGGGHSCVIL